jgi:hypothetical protein
MQFSNITEACCAGGKLAVGQFLPGRKIFRAQMSWPGEETIMGKISCSVMGALENLEDALAEERAATTNGHQ